MSHTTADLVFVWDPEVPLVVDPSIELPQLDLVKNVTGDCTQVYSTGKMQQQNKQTLNKQLDGITIENSIKYYSPPIIIKFSWNLIIWLFLSISVLINCITSKSSVSPRLKHRQFLFGESIVSFSSVKASSVSLR